MTQLNNRTAIFAFYNQFFSALLLGLPEEIHGDRVKYELQSNLNTAWQQLYGNIDSTLTKNKEVIPSTDPAMFSAAQQVKYMEEQVQVVVDKLGQAADLDNSEEYQNALMNLELAEHRKSMREDMLAGLLDVWKKYVGTHYEYKAYAERKSAARPVANKDELRKQLQARRASFANFHMTDAEQADVDGESA